MDYQSLMRQALLLARQASAEGDVPVGAVVVNDDGDIIGSGHNMRKASNDPTAHAEIVALRKAGEKLGSWRLDELTILVTFEPCAMCAGAIAQSRIKRLVFGVWDTKAGAVGSVWDIIRDRRSVHNIEVITEVLTEEIKVEMSVFFRNLRQKNQTYNQTNEVI